MQEKQCHLWNIKTIFYKMIKRKNVQRKWKIFCDNSKLKNICRTQILINPNFR